MDALVPTLTNLAVAGLIAGLAILIGALLFQLITLLLSKTHNVGLQLALIAAREYAHKAIFAGDEIALRMLDATGKVLDGWNRNQIADGLYDGLPPTLDVNLAIFHIQIPVWRIKVYVTRKMFEALVDDIFAETHAYILGQETYLKTLIDQWVEDENVLVKGVGSTTPTGVTLSPTPSQPLNPFNIQLTTSTDLTAPAPVVTPANPDSTAQPAPTITTTITSSAAPADAGLA